MVKAKDKYKYSFKLKQNGFYLWKLFMLFRI